MNDAGVKRFGSGWTWLVWDGTGLAVYSTPIRTPRSWSGRPLLGIDVWEHAYYLNYQNRRPDYLAAWWNVLNWDAVAARYEQRWGRLTQTKRLSGPAPFRSERDRGTGASGSHRDKRTPQPRQ